MNLFQTIASPFIVLLLTTASAQGQLYLGLSAGGAEYDKEGIRGDWAIPRILVPLPPGLSPLHPKLGLTKGPFQSENDAGKLYLGYRVNRHFALEGSYRDLPRFDFSQKLVTADPAGGSSTLRSLDFFNSAEIGGPVVTGMALLPFKIKNKQLEAFVKGGAFFWTADSQASRTARILHNDGFLFWPVLGTRSIVETSDSASGVSPVFGFGLEIGLYRGLALRVEAELFGDVGNERRLIDVVDPGDPSIPLVVGLETTTSAVSLGLRYRFGDRR